MNPLNYILIVVHVTFMQFFYLTLVAKRAWSAGVNTTHIRSHTTTIAITMQSPQARGFVVVVAVALCVKLSAATQRR